MKKVLIRFEHELGDCVQLTAVVSCLKKHRPDWAIDVVAPKGCFSALHDIANAVFLTGTEPSSSLYDQRYNLSWRPCEQNTNLPATNTVECLRGVFNIEPTLEELEYRIIVGNHARSIANKYIKSLAVSKGLVVLHGDIPQQVYDWIAKSEYTVLTIPDESHPIWEGRKTGDAETIAAIMQHASVVVATDGGPLKVAIATKVPTIALWRNTHPINSIDCTRTINVIPIDHAKNIKGNRDNALKVFESYQSSVYSENPSRALIQEIGKVLGKETPMVENIIDEVKKLLLLLTPEETRSLFRSTVTKKKSINPMPNTSPLKTKVYDFDYYEEHRRAGLDYMGHGEWQVEYGKWLVESLSLKGKSVLDVGCACGSIACGIAKAGSFVSGCDVNEHMIAKGRLKWLHDTLKVCDATNLHYWKDNTFDMVHSNNVFEHLNPDLVPFILEEIRRVTKPNGILFAVLDTEELYDRQGRKIENEDPTHICVKPISWWEDRLTGWSPAPDLMEVLKNHPKSYFNKYDWPCLVYRKNED